MYDTGSKDLKYFFCFTQFTLFVSQTFSAWYGITGFRFLNFSTNIFLALILLNFLFIKKNYRLQKTIHFFFEKDKNRFFFQTSIFVIWNIFWTFYPFQIRKNVPFEITWNNFLKKKLFFSILNILGKNSKEVFTFEGEGVSSWSLTHFDISFSWVGKFFIKIIASIYWNSLHYM